jgi:hypothetical protein
MVLPSGLELPLETLSFAKTEMRYQQVTVQHMTWYESNQHTYEGPHVKQNNFGHNMHKQALILCSLNVQHHAQGSSLLNFITLHRTYIEQKILATS